MNKLNEFVSIDSDSIRKLIDTRKIDEIGVVYKCRHLALDVQCDESGNFTDTVIVYGYKEFSNVPISFTLKGWREMPDAPAR